MISLNTIPIALASLTPLASSQYAGNNSIGSCADVDCPPLPGDTSVVGTECTIVDRTFSSIGFISFSSPILSNPQNLTWTVAQRVYDNYNSNDPRARTIEKGFYLGAPPSLDLKSGELPYQGCALFLYHNAAEFKEYHAGSCEDVIGAGCASSLVTQAETILSTSNLPSNLTTMESCTYLEKAMADIFPSSCVAAAGNDSWNTIKVIPLTGSKGVSPPSTSQNSSSNCHPTLPKNNTLSPVFAYNETGTALSPSTYHMIFSASLIVTTFFSLDGSVEGALSKPDANLACLATVDLTNDGLANQGNGEGAGMRMEVSRVWTAMGIAAVVLALLIG